MYMSDKKVRALGTSKKDIQTDGPQQAPVFSKF